MIPRCSSLMRFFFNNVEGTNSEHFPLMLVYACFVFCHVLFTVCVGIDSVNLA